MKDENTLEQDKRLQVQIEVNINSYDENGEAITVKDLLAIVGLQHDREWWDLISLSEKISTEDEPEIWAQELVLPIIQNYGLKIKHKVFVIEELYDQNNGLIITVAQPRKEKFAFPLGYEAHYNIKRLENDSFNFTLTGYLNVPGGRLIESPVQNLITKLSKIYMHNLKNLMESGNFRPLLKSAPNNQEEF